MPGRRHPAHRLERLGAHERRLRQAVHRRARDDRAPAGRHVGLGALRLARAAEARAGRRAGGAARVLGDQEQRPRRAHHLHRRGREFVPPKKGKKHVLRVVSEILSFAPRSAAHRPRRSGSSSWATSRAGGRWRSWSPTSWRRRRQLRARAAHHRAPPRPRSRWRSPIRWRRRCPNVGLVELEDPETGEVAGVRHRRAGGGGLRARSARGGRGARGAVQRCRWTPSSVRTDRPYLPALTTFFEARARRLRH